VEISPSEFFWGFIFQLEVIKRGQGHKDTMIVAIGNISTIQLSIKV
jgi:hypothetical protein